MFRLDNLGIPIEAPSAPYTYGRLIDSNPPGTGNGTPAVAAWANDAIQGMYAALDHFGLVPTDLQEQKGNSDFVRLLNAVLPVGAIFPVAYTTDPATLNIRALPCDGSAVSETTYADLFAAIANVWDTGGEPASTFRVPELRGEFLRGWDNGRGVDPARAFAAVQLDQLQGHWHDLYAANFSVVGGGGGANIVQGVGNNTQQTGQDVVRVAIADGVNGAPRLGLETRGRNQAVRWLIRY